MAENSTQEAQVKVTDDVNSHQSTMPPQSTAIKRKAEEEEPSSQLRDNRNDKRRRGAAPVKEEFLIKSDDTVQSLSPQDEADDDAAEAFHHQDRQPTGQNAKGKRRQNKAGQNKARDYGSSRDAIGLCSSRTLKPEFSPDPCRFEEKCKFAHDIREYLQQKREDLTTFNGSCPVWETKGRCPAGWKCRFVGSHSKEIEHEDGRKELVLVEDPAKIAIYARTSEEEDEVGVTNTLSYQQRMTLAKRQIETPKSQSFLDWLERTTQNPADQDRRQGRTNGSLRNSSSPEPENGDASKELRKADSRASFTDSPLRPSEKRKLYFGAETPIMAPLTTQGNLPYRRLCTSLGATFTYSEMAMSLPLLQGQKSEWALMKTHEADVLPPTFTAKGNIVYDYDQSRDISFGAQIAANKPWIAVKTTEVLTAMLPKGLRVVDLNVGCPIDLVYREGAGSALMDAPQKLDKMLRGMSLVSGETPVTVKIRMGTKDKQPTAQKLVDRLVLGSPQNRGDPCGVAAITLHGRSRQQRYTRSADWEYIADTAALIKSLNEKSDAFADTVGEVDERDLSNGSQTAKNGKVFFLGNGDVFSHEHYYEHCAHAGVDGVMAGRGALIKPWLFEEIQAGQYLDKSSSERLSIIERFCRYGLEAWGSDEIGVGQTRRFLLEWLSFACRYVPIGLLEYLPPNIQDRPPRFRGRDELETLMASDNYQDWIQISEMFLGKAHKDFRFQPKHKSNSYEIQAEG
ncbi:tRNA-dihydrouridine synthase 3 [Exophiala aquamarina CBS 119918]|uniref:tRNA-dihydrouridine(47) synthase [NAD(P)(+)] n=1 Tax=Exophiala aquamarina CBS 119918 TaxID=1182545 RepID=A0A072PCU7_9EURO|nr:tRNA-dihydrouridine synthase 3 [Exophiala aquamarina CBS 119918]KEF57118.1 tRNA-dihydrouridine synthase 3 [Exophiala aquamarina CBS 119918]